MKTPDEYQEFSLIIESYIAKNRNLQSRSTAGWSTLRSAANHLNCGNKQGAIDILQEEISRNGQYRCRSVLTRFIDQIGQLPNPSY